jgi:ketosteroid isomerase-like protein
MTESNESTLEERIYFLEQREMIKEAVCDYSMAVDDRDIETIANLFTENGAFGPGPDGTAVMESREEIVNFYNARLGSMGPTYHFPHAHKIEFIDETHATGIVLAHAELSQEGRTYYTGLRYLDEYHKENGQWRFNERILKFVFFMPMEEWTKNGMAQQNRKRFPGEGQLPTELPEMQPTWIAANKQQQT